MSINKMNKSFQTTLLGMAVLLVLSACSSTSTKKADEQVSANVDKTEVARVNTQLGVGYLQQGNYELALKKLNRALSFDNQYGPAHTTIAVLYEQIGEEEIATKHHDLAVKYSGRDPMVLNNYGRFLCKQNKMEAAEGMFLKALEDPLYESPELPYTNAAVCLMENKEYIKAEKYIRKALERNPHYAPALAEAADIAYNKGNYLSARGYLQRYKAGAAHTPRTLWLGIRTEVILGDKDALASYKLQLKSLFPNSEEAQNLKELDGASASDY